jgi:transposase
MNVLKSYLRQSVETLLKRGVSQREIARVLGVDPKTTRRISRELESNSLTLATGSDGQNGPNSRTPATGSVMAIDEKGPGWPPAPTAARKSVSACEAHRVWIEEQVRLGRNAVSIYQDLVDLHGFTNKYNSVKRFVSGLKLSEPERFDVLEFPPGEEAQVDYGQGALTLTEGGKYKRPYLFVMTLKYSGKSFRKATWRTSQEIWAELHEEGFRSLGGCPSYVVLDNLKEGVIKPDLYEPKLNPVYAAVLDHYGVVADPCRVRDPDRKGTVENGIQYTQNNQKGLKFQSIEAQNTRLIYWEETWASKRIHGRKKRQVMEMYLEEKPYLKSLPVDAFQMFKQGVRTVDDSGLVQVEGAYYSALPAALHSQVIVRIFSREIEILNMMGGFIRRHAKATRKGAFVMAESDRIFNPSRQTEKLFEKIDQIGPHAAAMAQSLFAKRGRPATKCIHGLSNLAKTYRCADIEAVCETLLPQGVTNYSTIKHALQNRVNAKAEAEAEPILIQVDPQIRPVEDYTAFWEKFANTNEEDTPNDYVIH